MFEVFIFTNGIFLGILLLIKRSDVKRANLFLALFLLSLSLELAPDFFEEEIFFVPESSFFTVPLLFFYVQQIIKGRILTWQWLLLVPGVAINLLLLSLGETEPDLSLVIAITIPFYLINLYLLFFMHRQTTLHQKQLKEEYTNLDTRTLRWVKGLVLIFLLFHFVWIVDDALLILDFDFPLLALLAELLTLASVFWVGYHGLGQKSSIFNTSTAEPANNQKAETSEQDETNFREILHQIEQNKLYLNQELTLRLLAQQVQINEKKLSNWINLYTSNNFYHLINSYRVSEFKKQLSLPENKSYSLLGIAQNSGFRNKSTFYKVFKELEGTTPSDYKKTLSHHSKV